MNLDALADTWRMFQREHRCSVDRMLCAPELRSAFVEAAAVATGIADEAEILWSLMGLRKRKMLTSTAK